MAEAVVVVEVLVAQAEGENALLEEFGERVLHQVGVAVIGKAGGELVEEVELGLHLAQQEAAGIGGDRSAVEVGDDVTPPKVLEDQFPVVTVCHGAAVSGVASKGLSLFPLCQLRNPRARPLVRKSG